MSADPPLDLIRQVRRAVRAEAREGKPRACAECGQPIAAREPIRVIVQENAPVLVAHSLSGGLPRCQR